MNQLRIVLLLLLFISKVTFSQTEGPALRQLVEDCYSGGNLVVGSACHYYLLGTKTEEILDTEFSYVTPANSFKQSYVHPEPGVWKWAKSDTWVKHCRINNQVLRMHAPISPQCSKWAKDDSRTAAELEQNLTEYMTALCKRYNDTTHIKWLDVVNETVSSDGTWFGPKAGTDKWENPWTIIGFDESSEIRPPLYIKKAFEIANENAPDLKLIINQHGGFEAVVWGKIKKLVAYLRENNLRVDGIGWQAHLWMGWEKNPDNLQRLSDFIDWCHANNLEFHITEFNVWLKNEDMDKHAEQARTFYEVTKLAASKQKTGVIAINYWHIRGVETANKDRDGCPWGEDYQPKEAYFRIRDALCESSEVCDSNCNTDSLILDVDTFGNGEAINMLGGEWLSFSDTSSTDMLDLDNGNGIAGTVCGKFEWMRKTGAVSYPYSGFQTYLNSAKKAVDLTEYYAIKFQARGTGIIDVGFVTARSETEGNHYYFRLNLKDDWTNIEIPFSKLTQNWGTISPIDTSRVFAIGFSSATDFNVLGEMWIDNIQIISENALTPVEPAQPPKPPKSYRPKINETGYFPKSFKEFSIVTDSVSAGQVFTIIDQENNVVYSGNIEDTPVNDRAISGETLYKGNFNDFNSVGKFRIKVGGKTSFPFQINGEVFDSTLYNSLRFFYLVRANNAINDDITGLAHPKSHTQDATLDDSSGNTLDLTGGWYNAGDYGKWVHTTAFACAHLMNLYNVNANYFKLQNLAIPESGNSLPDILDQVKVGLEWLLKMQRADGAVFHKVDTEPDFAYGYKPEEDPHNRKLSDTENLSTIDAADFTAVVAFASRVFAPFDPAFSTTCKTAALKSWEWVQANPGVGQPDIYYTDTQTWQEEMWAKAEIFMLAGDQHVLGSFYSDLTTKPVSFPSWTDPQMLSFAALHESPEVAEIVKSRIELKVVNYANELKEVVDKSGYGTAIDKYGWGWGTNTFMSNAGAVFIYAHQITGNDEWLKYASQQLDYLMGRNSLDYSFITGSRTNSCKHPYHWITKAYNFVPPGLIGQGATGAGLLAFDSVDDIVKKLMVAEFPPAKIYVDTVDSWNSNEVGIYTVSSLAYLIGYLSLYNRKAEITDATDLRNEKMTELEISYFNDELFCENCSGNTEVNLYNLNGQLLEKKRLNATHPKIALINYRKFTAKYPLILFRITDGSGKSKRGKLSAVGR